MNRMHRMGCAVGALLLVAAPTAWAQSGTAWSLQASALYVGLSGEAYDGLGGGLGLEAQARHNFPNYWSVGGGLQYSRHSFTENLTLDQPLSLVGVFIEPRRVIPTSSSKVAPYASGRLAILRQGTEVLGNNVSATGVQLNVGGGVLVALNPRTNLDLGLTLGRVQFGEYSTGVDAGSGTNVVLRVGISRGVGK